MKLLSSLNKFFIKLLIIFYLAGELTMNPWYGDWWWKKTASYCFSTQYLSPTGGNYLSQKSKWNCQPEVKKLSLGLWLLVLLMELERFLVKRMILVSENSRGDTTLILTYTCDASGLVREKRRKFAVSSKLNVIVLTLNSSIFIK